MRTVFVQYTCRKYLDTRAKAQRNLWLNAASTKVDVITVIGDPSVEHPTYKDNILLLPCDDDWLSLPYKTLALFKWFVTTRYDRLVKIDDDVWLSDELIDTILKDRSDYKGLYTLTNGIEFYGGPCYWLSKKAISAMIPIFEITPDDKNEDVLVSKIFKRTNIEWTPPTPYKGLTYHTVHKFELLFPHNFDYGFSNDRKNPISIMLFLSKFSKNNIHKNENLSF